MLVLHAIVGLEKGGAESMLHRLIKCNLTNQPNLINVVLSLTDIGYHGKVLEDMGIKVISLNAKGHCDLITKLPSTIRLIKILNPDIIQTWMIHADLFVGISAYIAGFRNIIWGIRTTDFTVESRSTRILRWFCARLSRFIPMKIVCAAQASMFESIRVGYCYAKMTVIPNGFDVPVLLSYSGLGSFIRRDLGISDDAIVIGCVGRFNPAKDHDNFLQAAAQLAARFPTSCFLMVGRELTQENMELRLKIHATGFANRFYLLGERTDPAACMDAMDVFVLSSRTEGFPNVLAEAMVMGVPCVTTDVGDAAFLINNPALVVPARDPIALALAVARIVELSVFERKTLGKKGRARVENEFSIVAAARKFNNLYEDLLRQKA